MSYYDKRVVNSKNKDVLLGRKIYMEALHGRRGFRYDQLGIEDEDIWLDIFKAMGKAAKGEMK